MALPVAILPLLKSIWGQSKWVIIISLTLFWSYVCYTAGQKSILKDLMKEESKAVVREKEKGVEAVKRAAADITRIKELEKSNDELTKKLDEIVNRPLCPIDDDSLRILEEVRISTERK